MVVVWGPISNADEKVPLTDEKVSNGRKCVRSDAREEVFLLVSSVLLTWSSLSSWWWWWWFPSCGTKLTRDMTMT